MKVKFFIKNLWIETEELTAGEELLTKSLEISEKISDERYVQFLLYSDNKVFFMFEFWKQLSTLYMWIF